MKNIQPAFEDAGTATAPKPHNPAHREEQQQQRSYYCPVSRRQQEEQQPQL